jgi:hypothetical protein
MSTFRNPVRFRRRPYGPAAFAAYHAECTTLLEEATELDAAQRALADQLAEVRRKLAEMRVALWPRVDRIDIVQRFRITRRGGPPPIPPVAGNAMPLHGKYLRSGALAVLARNDRPMTLTEIHRQLHLNGYAIASHHPVQRLADALAYETRKGRARHVDRATYMIDELNPGTRRGLRALRIEPAAQLPPGSGRPRTPRGNGAGSS